MAAAISKEATLSEVLAEVSILDVGLILKQALTGMGCFGIFILIGIGLEAGVNHAVPGFHVPSWLAWLFWLVVAWALLDDFTGDKSYHHWEFGWYFPKLRWWASLLFAAYVLGGFKLFLIAYSMNESAERTAIAAGSWLYLMPLFFALSVFEIGHKKLMAKRAGAELAP
jgi:hypothetical protein